MEKSNKSKAAGLALAFIWVAMSVTAGVAVAYFSKIIFLGILTTIYTLTYIGNAKG